MILFRRIFAHAINHGQRGNNHLARGKRTDDADLPVESERLDRRLDDASDFSGKQILQRALRSQVIRSRAKFIRLILRTGFFELHARGERGRQADARAENLDDERVARFDDFNLAPDAKPRRLEALDFLAVGFNAADNRARLRRKFVQPRRVGKRGRHLHHPFDITR